MAPAPWFKFKNHNKLDCHFFSDSPVKKTTTDLGEIDEGIINSISDEKNL